MVELILTEPQPIRLKAAVTTGSAESAALEGGKRFGSEVFSPEPIAVKCTVSIATRLEPGMPEAGVGSVHFVFGPRGSAVSGRQTGTMLRLRGS
jgi:hypothetical protein